MVDADRTSRAKVSIGLSCLLPAPPPATSLTATATVTVKLSRLPIVSLLVEQKFERFQSFHYRTEAKIQFLYRHYASVGGATRHTVVRLFVCLSFRLFLQFCGAR